MNRIIKICDLAKEITDKIWSFIEKGELKNADIDYKIAVDFDEEAAIFENYGALRASGWYGIHTVDTGFDSEDLHLVADYYGGGCPSFVHIWDGMERKEIEASILKALVVTLAYEDDFPFAKKADEQVYVETADPDAYRFVWKDQNDIGYHELGIIGPDGLKVGGSDMALWDYTGDWQRKNHRSRDVNDPETFYWTHCWGSSSSKLYTAKDNVTLEQVKAEMQDFLRQLYMRVYENAKNNEAQYKSLAQWCRAERKANERI